MTRPDITRTATRLNAEWEHLAAAPVPASWRTDANLGGPRATLADVLGRIRQEPDATLLALLVRHAAGDGVAGRLVVQAMLPKVIRLAARDHRADMDDYLAALWLRVASYPIARRPRRVAANLALDTLKAVTRSRPSAPGELPRPALPDPLGDATSVLDAGVRLGAIDALTRRTLEAVYVEGRTSRAAAVVLGTSADAVRWRCSRGVRALRAVASCLVDELTPVGP